VKSVGRLITVASILDEELVEDNGFEPAGFVAEMKRLRVSADLFTFAQKVPHVEPLHQYASGFDNAAVIPITTVADWEKRAEPDVRKAVRRARRSGVEVRTMAFDDDVAAGIKKIYDENPLRRGLPFPHYGKTFETVKAENSTYLDRSVYLGTFWNGELIGFIRWVQVGRVARTLQVIGMMKHFDKKPVNALIAGAVEECCRRRVSHFVYGAYVYNDPRSSLTEFKRRNGFEEMRLPRYYVPLTGLGHVALATGLHKPLKDIVPEPVRARLRTVRSAWYERRNRFYQVGARPQAASKEA
jgi:hypothetical protein